MRWPHERFLLRLHSSRAKLTRDFERDLKTGSEREFARRHFEAFPSLAVQREQRLHVGAQRTHCLPDLSHSLQICGRPFGLARA